MVTDQPGSGDAAPDGRIVGSPVRPGPRGPARPAPGAAPESGGDPACWADRVCPECGGLTDGDVHAHRGE